MERGSEAPDYCFWRKARAALSTRDEQGHGPRLGPTRASALEPENTGRHRARVRPYRENSQAASGAPTRRPATGRAVDAIRWRWTPVASAAVHQLAERASHSSPSRRGPTGLQAGENGRKRPTPACNRCSSLAAPPASQASRKGADPSLPSLSLQGSTGRSRSAAVCGVRPYFGRRPSFLG